MITYLISLVALAAVFAIATVRPINMGLLGFAAAFLVGGWVSGMSMEEIQGLFPGDMFLVVFGITLLFGIARVNGTMDLIMDAALKAVRGKPWAIVWLMYLLAALLMALGSVLAVGMLAPIAMPLARRHGIDPLLMGMMISHGALGAAFSPITVYSVGIGELTDDYGIEFDPVLLFAIPFALNLLLATLLFIFRGRHLRHNPESISAAPAGEFADGEMADGASAAPAVPAAGQRPTMTFDNWLTYAAMAALLVTALMGVDVGVAATCLGTLLLVVSPRFVQPAMKAISWPAVLLVCGIVTYMGVLAANGTIDYMGGKAAEIPWPLLTALVMFVAVGMISAVGSSFGIILISLPLAAPLLANGDLGVAGFVIALAFCATVTDVSPFSTNGVIVLASAQVDDKQRFQRRMLAYTGYIILLAPLLAWLLVVVPTST